MSLLDRFIGPDHECEYETQYTMERFAELSFTEDEEPYLKRTVFAVKECEECNNSKTVRHRTDKVYLAVDEVVTEYEDDDE